MIRRIIILCLTLLSPRFANAETIEAFRLSSQPEFQNGSGSTIYMVDAMSLITQQLSVGLPPNPQEASRIATQRLKALTPQDKQAMRIASQSRIRAAEYQLVKSPAIVFDGKAVLYGIYDIAQARSIYRAWQSRSGE